MKRRLIFIFLLFVALFVRAQSLQKTAVFDFSNPQSLSTPITPSSTGGGGVPLENTRLVSGSIELTFGHTSISLPPEIWTYENPINNNKSFYLRLRSGSSMTINALNEASLCSIKMDIDGDQGQRGSIYLVENKPGIFSAWDMLWEDKTWITDSTWIPTYPTEVSFATNGNASQISKMTVTYLTPAITLVPTCDFLEKADSIPIPFFKNMVLTFPNAEKKIQSIGDSVMTIKGTFLRNKEQLFDTLKIDSVSGNQVYLSVENAIQEDGKFEVLIPQKSFIDESGYMNIEYRQSFRIYEPRETFNRVSVDPVEGNIKAWPDTIKIIFPDIVRLDAEELSKNKVIIFKGRTEKYPAILSNKENSVLLTLPSDVKIDNVEENLCEWKIVIPEKIIHNIFIEDTLRNRWNAADTLRYNMVDSLKELKDSCKNLIAEADTLFNYIGKVGYPVADDGKVKLADVKDIEVPATEEELTEAIDDLKTAIKGFYDNTEVILPTLQKWYTIVSVNNQGKELPLSYKNDSVTLGQTPVAFQVDSVSSDGTVIFKIKDGADFKYLHVLLPNDDYNITSSKNLLTEKNKFSHLTLSKMLIRGEDQKPVAGLFSIKGGLGLDNELNFAGDGYAMVDFTDSTIVKPLDAAEDIGLLFEEELTNAFRLRETEEPSDEPEVALVEPTVSFVESIINSDETKLTLIINGISSDSTNTNVITNVSLKELGTPFFKARKEDNTEGDTIKAFTGDYILEPFDETQPNNRFKVHVNGLDDGKYYLVLPLGTFDYTQNEKPVKDIPLKVAFEINSIGNPDLSLYDRLEDNWGFIPYLVQGNAINSSDLYNMIVYMNESIYPTKNANHNKISLWRPTGDQAIIAGHFVDYPLDGRNMLKVVFDSEFPSLDKGEYTFIIEEGAFGDEKFHQYQNGDSILKPADCKINNQFFKNVTIDNTITDIDNISANYSNTSTAFDLTGRRIGNKKQKGLYIVNGRKLLVK